MALRILLLLLFFVCTVSSWSLPFYPVQTRRAPRSPLRIARFVPIAHAPVRHFHHRIPIRPEPERKQERPKRDHDFEPEFDHDSYDDDHNRDHHHDHHDHSHGRHSGVTGPVHTFVKTDKNANYKWGVRHHVGNKYAS